MERLLSEVYEFGNFRFNPAERYLLLNGEPVPLTPKAFDTLFALVTRSGHLVTKEDLLKEVWQDAFVEEATVVQNISTLRKVLSRDGPDNPFIETIPKRGYRLRAEAPGQPRPAVGRPLVLALIAGAVLALAILAAALQPFARSGGEIAVMDVANATGDPRYSPVARATSELIVNELDKRGFAVRRDGGGDLLLRSKLVIWDGLPYLSMTATDRSGVIRWSSMSKATQGAIPPSVGAGVEELAGRFPPRVLRQRVADGGRRR